MRNQILMVTSIQWPFRFFSQYSSTKAKKKKKVHIKTPPTSQEYTTQFFINLTLKTTKNGSKEEGLPQG